MEVVPKSYSLASKSGDKTRRAGYENEGNLQLGPGEDIGRIFPEMAPSRDYRLSEAVEGGVEL